METITLTRTGLPPLEFSGAEIASSLGEWPKNDKPGRVHDIVIYRTSSGKRYVVYIAYRTSWPNDLNYSSAQIVDNPAEVVKVLTGYNPADHIRGYPPGPQYEKRQAQMLAEVKQRYASQISAVLADHAEFVERIE